MVKKDGVSSKHRVVSKDHPIIKKKIDRALKRSIHEGKYAAAEAGFGGHYVAPFVIAAGASSALVGVFNAVISFVPSIFQVMTAKLVEKHSRKKIVIPFAYARALSYLLLCAMALLFLVGHRFTAWAVIGVATLSYILTAPADVAWFSWMGSLVPKEQRGAYFARRNKVLGTVTLITMLLAAVLLDYFREIKLVMLGFAVLFLITFVCKAISVTLLSGQYEPRLKVTKKDEYTFRHFLKDLRTTPFGRFVAYVSLFRIMWYIGAPFFAVYMLRDLGFTYSWYMAILVSITIFQLAFYPVVGKISDKFGNARLMRLATMVISITPFLWLVSPNKFYLIFVTQLTAGFGMAAFFLASNNYIYDSLDAKKRTFGLSYFNLLGGISIAIGAGIGSLLALTGITFLGYNTLFIVAVAGVSRVVFYFLSNGMLKEVRHVEKFKYHWLFKEMRAEGMQVQRHAVNNVKTTVEHVVRPKELIKFENKIKEELKEVRAVERKLENALKKK